MHLKEPNIADYIILNGIEGKDAQAARGPSSRQITAWEREIIKERQNEAAKDIADKNCDFVRTMLDAEVQDNQAEIDYAASLIKPKLELQKVRRLIETTPHLKRGYAMLQWSQARGEGPLKTAAYEGFLALAGKDANKILSMSDQEKSLVNIEEVHKIWRQGQAREREQLHQRHERLIQHLEIMRTDPNLRAYDREILDKRIADYVTRSANADASVLSHDAILGMMPPVTYSKQNYKSDH